MTDKQNGNMGRHFQLARMSRKSKLKWTAPAEFGLYRSIKSAKDKYRMEDGKFNPSRLHFTLRFKRSIRIFLTEKEFIDEKRK